MSPNADTLTPAAEPDRSPPRDWWAGVDRFVDRFSDRLNPLLVKETRQALKSRQFLITFGLLLIFGWGWSILGTAMIGPDVHYATSGPEMFLGYFMILSFPLLVIVPFGAFRSLAGEKEDRTFDLLSITALNPRQIIRGKLGSAVLQMVIYLSAISPCLAFTYMLGGISAPTILYMLFLVVAASLGLSMAGLLVATVREAGQWRSFLMVVVVCVLIGFFWSGCALAVKLITYGLIPFTDAEFYQGNGAALTAYGSYFLLLYYAAAAQLSFSSDNRSTRLRVIMLTQFVLWTGWLAWFWIGSERGDIRVLMMFVVGASIHWGVMGAMMTGEHPELSPRVKRSLPQSLLSRSLFTWFNPGPATGFLFATAGLLGMCVLLEMAVAGRYLFGPVSDSRWSQGMVDQLHCLTVLMPAYIIAYLGAGLVVIRLLRKFYPVGILLGVLVHVVLVMVGTLGPLVLHLMSPGLRYMGYSLLQARNPFWSLTHVVGRSTLPPEAPALMVIVPIAALVMFAVNVPSVAEELRQVRISKPRRVAEDDAARYAQRHPPQPSKPTDPWDQ
ncbi:MAG: hypothetical protein HQ581_07175 [Planctomycetes bacterium]|nr:hypothetical protein [Planctomycetota bacterium]